MFTSAILTEFSRNFLKEIASKLVEFDENFLFQTEQGVLLPHHMTINLGDFDEKLNNPEILGCDAELFIDKIVFDPELGICAATVAQATAILPSGDQIKIQSANKCPHITIALKKGVKPKFSNQMLEQGTGKTFESKVFRLEAKIACE